MVQVGSLDYGAHFEVHKSDIKPILKDLAAEYSIPYRVRIHIIFLILKFHDSNVIGCLQVT